MALKATGRALIALALIVCGATTESAKQNAHPAAAKSTMATAPRSPSRSIRPGGGICPSPLSPSWGYYTEQWSWRKMLPAVGLSPSPPPPSTSLAFNSILSTRRDELESAAWAVERSIDVGLELRTPIRTYVLQERILNWNPALEIDDVGPKERQILQDTYDLRELFAGGSCGEVWLAYTMDRQHQYVLKRIFSERGDRYIRAGNREVYFGTLLRNEPRVSRFIEAFNRTSPATDKAEMWLVFEDEGRSLKSFLYRTSARGLISPSEFWTRLRTQENGPRLRRELIRHLVLGLDALARKGVTHRDIKPSNIFITPARLVDEAPVKIGDFGSAVDEHSLRLGMFGPSGPSREEHTKEYEPPEAADDIESGRPFTSYFDAWSLGAVCLEVLLGTDQFFYSSKGRTARAGKRHKSLSIDRLGGFEDLVEFNQSVTAADTFGRGFYDDATHGALELDFVFRLLQPLESRMSIEQAAEHPYVTGAHSHAFSGGPQHFRCSCGRLFTAHSACMAHASARRHNLGGATCKVEVEPRLAEVCSSFLSPPAPGIGLCGDRGGRLKMEDSGGARNADLVVIADGHQGHGCARFALEQLLDKGLNACEGPSDWPLCARHAFESLHEAWKQSHPGDHSGAAVTAVKRVGDLMLVANVGDVKAVACCDDQDRPIVLTIDHVASNASEAELVRQRGGFITPAASNRARERVNGQLVLTRCIGDVSLDAVLSREPSTFVLKLEPNISFLIVASDGVWDALSPDEVIQIAKTDSSLVAVDGDARRVAARIVLEAKARGLTIDNSLCAVIVF